MSSYADRETSEPREQDTETDSDSDSDTTVEPPPRSTGAQLRRSAKEIYDLANQYQSDEDKPPFTASELVVMVCLTNTDTSSGLTISEISLVILNLFPYYRRQAMESYARMQLQSPDYSGEPEFEEIADGFEQVFQTWEVPLVLRHEPGRAVWWDKTDEDEICVPPEAGRVFLSKWLEPERKGTFSFFKLPPELRNSIYEMVFSFPREGIVVSGSPGHLRVIRRPEQPVNLDLWDFHTRGFDTKLPGSDDVEDLALTPKQQNLAFLQVNKQIHDEALPFFFQVNRFYCVGRTSSISFLNALSTRRVEHLQDLRIDITQGYDSPEGFSTAMKSLVEVKRLRRLQIHVRIDHWLVMNGPMRQILGRTTKFTKYAQIPGFKDLAVACWKAESVEWSGAEHETIKRWVEREVEWLIRVAKPPVQPISGGRKRKATARKDKTKLEVEENDGLGSRKKTKRI